MKYGTKDDCRYVQQQFQLRETPKVHIVLQHIPDFIRWGMLESKSRVTIGFLNVIPLIASEALVQKQTFKSLQADW